jgi:hypothetical protein
MRIAHTPGFRVLLVALSVLCLALSYWLQFRAGCAGDVKSGALGDPQRALQLEYIAFPFFLLAVGAGVAVLLLYGRLAIASAFFLIGGPLMWYLGVQLEVWGVQHCF